MFETYEDYLRWQEKDAKENPMPERKEERLCPCGDPAKKGKRWCENCWEYANMIADRLITRRVAAGVMPDDAFEDVLRAYDSLTDNVGHFDDSKPWEVANVDAAAKRIAYVNGLNKEQSLDILGDVLDEEWHYFQDVLNDRKLMDQFDRLRGHSDVFRKIPYRIGCDVSWAEKSESKVREERDKNAEEEYIENPWVFVRGLYGEERGRA